MAMNSIGANPNTTTQQILNQPGLVDAFREMESFTRFALLYLQMPNLLPTPMRVKVKRNLNSAFTWSLGGVIFGIVGNLQIKNYGEFLNWPLAKRIPIRLAIFAAPFLVLYPMAISRNLQKVENCRQQFDREYFPLIRERKYEEYDRKKENMRLP